MGTSRDILDGYVDDMLLVERELHAAIRRQRDDDSARRHPAVYELLARTEQRLDEHIAALEQALEDARVGGSVVRSALGAILGAGAGLFDRIRLDTQLSRMLRDDYAALSFASICYEMLHTTALGVRQSAVAALALNHLADYARLIVEIGEIMPAVLLDELQQEDVATPDPAVVTAAQRNVRAAWSAEAQTPAPA